MRWRYYQTIVIIRMAATMVRLGLLLVLVMSCSSAQDAGTACDPGASLSCVGVTGCQGAQVCNTDGSGFGTCTCSPGSASGGASHTSVATGGATFASAGGKSGTGIAANTGATSGLGGANAGSGGTKALTSGGNATCKPSNMSGYTYPQYVPARRLKGSCTTQTIGQYYDDCIVNDNCDAYLPGGKEETCGACLNPTTLESTSYGPVLKAGNDWTYFYEVNTAGCLELLGETACAPKVQAKFLCHYGACKSNCALATTADFDPLMQCMSNADNETCAAAVSAADCVKDSKNLDLCTGPGFMSQFFAVASAFCL